MSHVPMCATPPLLPFTPAFAPARRQFDVLWNELSGTEHLTIYGHIKGLRFSEVRGGWRAQPPSARAFARTARCARAASLAALPGAARFAAMLLACTYRSKTPCVTNPAL